MQASVAYSPKRKAGRHGMPHFSVFSATARAQPAHSWTLRRKRSSHSRDNRQTPLLPPRAAREGGNGLRLRFFRATAHRRLSPSTTVARGSRNLALYDPTSFYPDREALPELLQYPTGHGGLPKVPPEQMGNEKTHFKGKAMNFFAGLARKWERWEPGGRMPIRISMRQARCRPQ